MKKVVVVCAVLFAAILGSTRVEAKSSQKGFYSGNTYQKGQFRFTYMAEEKGIWITKITPLSDKGISTLKIPSRLNGSKVVKLGAAGDAAKPDDDPNTDTNLFGVEDNEDLGIAPQKIYNRTKKIKTIKIPSTVKIITQNCFYRLQNGKNINIPAGVDNRNVINFTDIKWNKIKISSKNKKYKVANGCLLSKSGKTFYGFLQKRKKVVIPSTVKRIDVWGDKNGCSTIVIPKSVEKIDRSAMETDKPVKVKVAKGNKRYVEKNGLVYSKVSGRLAIGYVKNGVLKIPKGVTKIDGNGLLGKSTIQEVIIPASVKKISSFYHVQKEEGRTACIFRGKNPPKLGEKFFSNLIIYVPKGCADKYKKKWKVTPYDNITLYESK